MALGRICPASSAICTRCPKRCRRRPKRMTEQRQRNHQVYASAAHKQQRLRVLRRDHYTCVDCGWRDHTETGRNLVADHVYGIDAVRTFADSELATRCLVCSGHKDGGRQASRRG